MNASILGLGQWLPDTVRTNDDWPSEFRATRRGGPDRELVDIDLAMADACDRIAARHLKEEADDPFLGAKRRRIADVQMTACDAETFAAKKALQEAGIRADQLDLVVSWAAVPDRIVPPSAPRVAHSLGAHRALAVGMDAGCATTITQLMFAAAMIEANRVHYALLTQSHLITRAFPMMHPASPNVGDGATAIVVGATERRGILAFRAITEGEYYNAVTWRRGPAEDPPWWLPGREFYLGSHDREGARHLIRNAVRIGRDTLREVLDDAHMPASRIDVLASVQPRRWIPAAIAEALGIPPERAPQTFDELAHLGGCGVITNLLEGRRRGLLSSGAIVALYAQGAGFTRSAALLEWA